MRIDECEFNLASITLRAKRWCSEDVENENSQQESSVVRVIALHGWLDNAASFDFFIPELIQSQSAKSYDIVALDLLGHGLSDQRPGLGAYNIWQDVLEVIMVANELGWETFSLLGHSRGAMICNVLAGSFPERVNGLVMIEALAPQAVPAAELPNQLASSINALLSLQAKKRNYYSDFEEAVKARSKGFFHLPLDAAGALAARGVTKTDKGYYWNSDARLLAPSEIKLTEEQASAFVDKFSVKAMVIVASEGLLNTPDVINDPLFKHESIDTVHYQGDHHLHLTASLEIRKTMANGINKYYENIQKN